MKNYKCELCNLSYPESEMREKNTICYLCKKELDKSELEYLKRSEKKR